MDGYMFDNFMKDGIWKFNLSIFVGNIPKRESYILLWVLLRRAKKKSK